MLSALRVCMDVWLMRVFFCSYYIGATDKSQRFVSDYFDLCWIAALLRPEPRICCVAAGEYNSDGSLGVQKQE